MALFRRTRHGVALTPAGADYARQIARQLDTMERDTLDAMARQGLGGSLAAGGGADLRHALADPAAAGLRGAASRHHGAHRDAHPPLPVQRHALRRRALRRHAGADGQLGRHAVDRAAARGRGAGVQPGAAGRAQAAVAGRGRAAAAAAAEHPARRLAPVVRRAAGGCAARAQRSALRAVLDAGDRRRARPGRGADAAAC